MEAILDQKVTGPYLVLTTRGACLDISRNMGHRLIIVRAYCYPLWGILHAVSSQLIAKEVESMGGHTKETSGTSWPLAPLDRFDMVDVRQADLNATKSGWVG